MRSSQERIEKLFFLLHLCVGCVTRKEVVMIDIEIETFGKVLKWIGHAIATRKIVRCRCGVPCRLAASAQSIVADRWIIDTKYDLAKLGIALMETTTGSSENTKIHHMPDFMGQHFPDLTLSFHRSEIEDRFGMR